MKIIDLTLLVTPAIRKDIEGVEKKSLTGHLGTHFDCMDKVFPLELTELDAIVFDIRSRGNGIVHLEDVDLDMVERGMFVGFCSDYTGMIGYGTPEYSQNHPELSMELIQALLDRGVCIIGIDFAGVRRGKEHTPADQLCADRGCFVVENLVNLAEVLDGKEYARFKAHTYPMNFSGLTGLPCRVVATIE